MQPNNYSFYDNIAAIVSKIHIQNVQVLPGLMFGQVTGL